MPRSNGPQRDRARANARRRGPLLFFIHIPKTAGTTLRSVLNLTEPGTRSRPLGNVFKGGGGVSEGLVDRVRKDLPLDLDDVGLVRGHVPLGAREYLARQVSNNRAISCFTFLREPVDRTVSHFFAVRAGAARRSGVKQAPLAADATLDDALAGGYIHDNLHTRMLSGLLDPFGEVNEAMLEQAKRNLREELAFFGLTERFDESLVLARRRLGFSAILYSSSGRVNADRPRGDAVPDEFVEAARRANRYDAELYAHAQELFDSAPEREDLEFEVELAALRAARGEGEIDQAPVPAGFGGDEQAWRMLLHARATLIRVERELARKETPRGSGRARREALEAELEAARAKTEELEEEIVRLNKASRSRSKRGRKRRRGKTARSGRQALAGGNAGDAADAETTRERHG